MSVSNDSIAAVLSLSRDRMIPEAVEQARALASASPPDEDHAAESCLAVVEWRAAANAGRVSDGLIEAIAGIARLEDAGYLPHLGWIFSTVGLALALLGDFERGLEWCERGIEEATTRDDHRHLIIAHGNKGAVLGYADELDRAAESFETVLRLCGGEPNVTGMMALSNLAYCQILRAQQDDVPDGKKAELAREALQYATDALSVGAALPGADARLLAHAGGEALCNQGNALCLLGRLDEAETAFTQGLQILEPYPQTTVELMVSYAGLLLETGRQTQADALLQTATTMLQSDLVDRSEDRILELRIRLAQFQGRSGEVEILWANRLRLARKRYRDRLRNVRRHGDLFTQFREAQKAEQQAQEQAAALRASEEQLRITEQRLLQRERDLYSVLDSVPSMISYWDRNLRNRFGNHAYSDWFDIDPAAMPGMHVRDVIGEELYRQNQPYLEAVLRGETQEFERAIPSPGGKTVRHHLAKYVPDIVAGEVQGFYVQVTDITPQKNTETALREAQKIGGVGSYDLDVVTGRWTSTETLDEIFGIDASYVRDLDGWAARIHPDEREELSSYLQAVIARRSCFDREFRIVRACDGAVRHIHGRGNVFCDAQGQSVRLFGTVQDVTRRVQTAEILRQSKTFAEGILNSVSDHIAVLDQSGTIVMTNDAWRQFSLANNRASEKMAPNTGIGVNYLDACRGNPDDTFDEGNKAREGIRAVLDGRLEKFVLEYPCHCPVEQRWFLMSVTPLGSNPRGAVIVHSNITERKEAEMALKENDKILRQAQRIGGVGSYELDFVKDWCTTTEVLDEILGIDADYVRDTKGWLKLLHPDDRDPLAAYLQGVIARRERFDCEYRIVRPSDGEQRWVHGVGEIVCDVLGEPLRMAGTIQDVTLRKQTKEALLRAKEGADAANRAKSRFLATMSHEIRTPMNGILGMAQVLLAADIPEAVRKDYVRTILNSGETLLALINDILDLSKVEAGKIDLASGAFDPAQIMQETQSLFAEAAQHKGLRLEAGYFGPVGQHYLGDRYRLRQMLTNLVNNAIKFTTQGHVRIEVREIERKAQTAVLEFSVDDSGIGIAPETKKRIFQPFAQADSSTTRQFGGTGLGLSIVRELAQAMGGEVGVESQVGQGSRFWFQIRADLVAEGAERRDTERATDAGTTIGRMPEAMRGHILLVDDNVINRAAIGAMLSIQGLPTETCENGEQAVAAILGGMTPDLVLMDCEMPVMDGFEATARIRAWEAETGRPRLAIVALTAAAFEEDRKRCLDAGMDDFLTKPLAVDKLTTTLSHWLNPDRSKA